LSPAVRWWLGAGVVVVICTAAAVASFLGGNWLAGALLLTLAIVTPMNRWVQVLAHRAGYWRGCYETVAGLRPNPWNGWQPAPWDDVPPPSSGPSAAAARTPDGP
jgi:hypothetical protein